MLRGCNTALVTGTYFAGIVSLILALLPFFSMCCCVAAPVRRFHCMSFDLERMWRSGIWVVPYGPIMRFLCHEVSVS